MLARRFALGGGAQAQPAAPRPIAEQAGHSGRLGPAAKLPQRGLGFAGRVAGCLAPSAQHSQPRRQRDQHGPQEAYAARDPP